MMPATGLKIVGTGACLPWCSISSFQNSLKTSVHRVYEFLDVAKSMIRKKETGTGEYLNSLIIK